MGVAVRNIPKELIQVVKKKARNAREALTNFKHYIKNLKCDYITPSRLKKLNKQLEKKVKEAVEERKRIFTFRKEVSAFNNYLDQHVIDGRDDFDGLNFLREAKPSIINVFNSNRNMKTILYLHVIMKKEGTEGIIRREFAFHSSVKKIF